MIKKMTIAIITMLVALFMVGIASADSVSIDPGTEPIIVPVGVDAFTSSGLSAVYTGISVGSTYSVVVRKDDGDESGPIVYSVPNADGSLGPIPATPSYTQEVHWIPADTDTYTIYANGASESGKRRISAQSPISPVPEIATVGLVGLGLVGMVILRRKK